MKAEVIKEFLVKLGFQVNDSEMAKFTSGIANATVAVTAMGVAATAMATAVFAGVKGVATHYNDMARLAMQFRSTAHAIEEFIDTTKILGMSESDSIESLRSLDRAIVDTSMGIGRTKLVFKNLGISVTDAFGKIKPTTDVMGELAEKFKTMERGKQLRVMERLGLSPGLIRVFSANIDELHGELGDIEKAVGLNFDQSVAEGKAFIKMWRSVTQEIEKFKLVFSKAYDVIAVKMMPKLRSTMDNVRISLIAFRRMVMDVMPLVIAKTVPVINIILRVAEAFVSVSARIASGAAAIIGWLIKINSATDGWAGYIGAAIVAWRYLNFAFLTTPLGQLIALSTAVALLIDDFLTFKEGGDSLLNWGGQFGLMLKMVTTGLSAFLGYLVLAKTYMIGMAIATRGLAVATGILNGVLATARLAVFLFNMVLYTNPIGVVVGAITLLIGAGILLIKNWDTVKRWFTSFFDFILRGFDKIASFAGKIAGLIGFGDGFKQPILTPSNQTQAIMGGRSQNVNQQTQIVVQGLADPNATARAVAGQQGRVNADMARNMRTVAR